MISSACITWLDHAAAIWCIGYGTLRCIVQSTRMKAGSDGLLSSIAMGLLAAGIVLAVKVPGDGGHAGNTGQDVGVSLQASYLVVAVAVSLIVAASMGLRMRSGAAAT